ncbi:head-tail adaptor [Salmonella enterica subsp. diarizonae]|nr:head-tail adaptor [Salmonella enterica subsp. diarizonae]
MRAGKMRHRITIQAANITRDAAGEPLHEWYDVATVWADVQSISSREYLSGGVESLKITNRIWTRYLPGITSDNRIIYSSKNAPGSVFNIDAVLPDARLTRLEILCSGGGHRDQSRRIT